MLVFDNKFNPHSSQSILLKYIPPFTLALITFISVYCCDSQLFIYHFSWINLNVMGKWKGKLEREREVERGGGG